MRPTVSNWAISWVIGMGDLDETLVTDVMAEATPEDQIAVLGTEWGEDWFVVA